MENVGQPYYTSKQFTDLETGSHQLVSCMLSGGDYEAKFETLWNAWIVQHGIPVPPTIPHDAPGPLKWHAARNRLMVSFCLYGRRALRKESHRLLPLLNYHLADLTETVRYCEHGAPEESEEIQDVTMGDAEAEAAADPLTAAFNNLRMNG